MVKFIEGCLGCDPFYNEGPDHEEHHFDACECCQRAQRLEMELGQARTAAVKPVQYGEDVRGMSCECGKGRIGDGHSCYMESLDKQRNAAIIASTGNTEEHKLSDVPVAMDFEPATDEELKWIKVAIMSMLLDNDENKSQAAFVFNKVMKRLAIAESSPSSPLSEGLEKIVKFLLGEGELDGRMFGDEPPRTAGGYKRNWWWRKNLAQAYDAMPHLSGTSAERDRVKFWKGMHQNADARAESSAEKARVEGLVAKTREFCAVVRNKHINGIVEEFESMVNALRAFDRGSPQ